VIRTVVFAKGERAVPCLNAMLQAGFRPQAVLPEGDDVGSTAWAQAERIPLLSTPEDLLKIQTDVLVLAGYARILREPFLSHAKLGTLNLHGGKLPEYRGASVLNWQIINGEREGGVAVIFADQGVDTGDIAAEGRYPIDPGDTIREVSAKAFTLFPGLLVGVLRAIENGTVKRVKQSPSEGATYHKRKACDGRIAWDAMRAEDVYNLTRALTRPYPGAFTFLDGKKISIWAVRVPEETFKGLPGRIMCRRDGRFIVIAKDRGLIVTDFSVDGLDGEAAREFLKSRVGRDFRRPD
jgi:methionyl-tRNA formyltransferase